MPQPERHQPHTEHDESHIIHHTRLEAPTLDGGFFDVQPQQYPQTQEALEAAWEDEMQNIPKEPLKPYQFGPAFRENRREQETSNITHLFPNEHYEKLNIELLETLEDDIQTMPFDQFVNSLLNRLNYGELKITDVELLIQKMGIKAFTENVTRATEANKHVDKQTFKSNVAEWVNNSVKPEGSAEPIDIEEALNALSSNYGKVITSHPTYGLSYKLTHLYQKMAKQGVDTTALLKELEKTEILPQANITLPLENGITMESCMSLQEALTDLHSETYANLIDIYGAETVRNAKNHLRFASIEVWAYGDSDGRTDVDPQKAWSAFQLRKKLFFAHARDMLEKTGLQKTDMYRALTQISYKKHEQEEDDVFLWERETKSIQFEELLTLTNEYIASAPDNKKLIAALTFRDKLYATGLSITRHHFRTNEKNLKAAVDIAQKIDDYPTSIDSLVNTTENRAENMMILARAIKDDIDNKTPIRYLIAETHGPEPVMEALRFAKKHGVDDIIDLSPLFEDEIGIDNAEQTMRTLLYNREYREYRDYALQRRVINIQVGQSDSGRYLGQPASGMELDNMFMNMTNLLDEFNADYLAKRLQGVIDEDPELRGKIKIRIFTTGGEATGRGAPPWGLPERLTYHAPPRHRRENVHFDTAFQGEAKKFSQSPDMARSTLFTINKELTREHTEAELNDPLYLPENKDFVHAFSKSIRSFNAFMRNLENHSYGKLISLLNMMGMKYGSRPKKRSKLSDGDNNRDPITEIRAIGHTNRLQLIAMFLTTFAGAGYGENPNEFENKLMELAEHSPRLRLLMDMIANAFDHSFLDIFIEKVESVNPEKYAAIDHKKDMQKFFDFEHAQAAIEAIKKEHQRSKQLIQKYRSKYNNEKRALSEEIQQQLRIGHGVNTMLVQAYFQKILINAHLFTEEEKEALFNFDLGCDATELKKRIAPMHQKVETFSLNGNPDKAVIIAELNALYRLIQRSISVLNLLNPALG